ncbi:MAG: hypothetical protein NDJ89_15020 [Oligoflexia bacterium]|nr:hypothetical protein [Oligoflexia bacterium]
MPRLNWKSGPVARLEPVEAHPKAGSLLRVSVAFASLPELVHALGEAFEGEHSELRLELPQEWLIFWKRREQESRLLLAHPEPGVWVATVALELPAALALLQGLRKARPGDSVAVGELAGKSGRIGSVSNVEILISVV